MMTRSLFHALVLGALVPAALHAQAALRAQASGARASIEPTAPQRLKPARAVLGDHDARDRVRVKFHDGLVVRARGGLLTDLGTGALAEAQPVLQRFADGEWRRAHVVGEARLDELRARARARLARHVADLNLQFDFVLPEGVSPEEAIDAFNALDVVELADAAPLPAPAPVPPDYQPFQAHLAYGPTGLGAELSWSFPGGDGAGVRVCDIEYSFNASHADLPPVTIVGAPVVDPFSNPQHGTAVLGVIAAVPNGFGVTGMAHAASCYFAGANTTNGYHVDAAILAAAAAFSAGDVIVVEQQSFGPGNFLVPVEWDLPVYNAIVTAVGNGIVVLEAAGNHGRNLDAPEYSTANGGHWPFLPQNDSGAIIVGGGATPLGADVDRSRLGFSCYGSTVDLQGWGEKVITSGFGALYSAEGPNQYYHNAFNGTSSATALVGAACVIVQSVHKARTGQPLAPLQLRDLLRATGSPQQSGANPSSQNIGPRPDIAAAVQAIGDAAGITLCAGDARATLCPCGNDAPAQSGRGCLNSLGLGASLVATGTSTISNDTFRLVASSMTPQTQLLFFQGTSSRGGSSFGDGLRCAIGTVVRLGLAMADPGGGAVYPSGVQTPVSLRGQVTGPGQRSYQAWYRNAVPFCDPATFNLTNSLTAQWAP